MPTNFSEWTSVIQILALVFGAFGVVVGLRSQIAILTSTLKTLTQAIDDLRHEMMQLDRRLSFLEGKSEREKVSREKWEADHP